MKLYITKKMAIDAGLTHEGYLFGLPAWFGEHDGEICAATPKFTLGHAWCWLADKFYECASYFVPSDTVIESPIRIVSKIDSGR